MDRFNSNEDGTRPDIEEGMIVDYHSIIGGPVTSTRHEVLEVYPEPNTFGTAVAKISGKSGVVDIDALSTAGDNNR